MGLVNSGDPAAVTLLASLARRTPLWLRRLFYRLGPLTRWLRRTVNRAVPEGVHPVRVAAGDLRGKWLLLDLQVDKDLWLGAYEPEVAQAIRRFVRPGSTAYDLGANVGYTSLLLADAVGASGQVVAFEPLPRNVERLRRGIGLNHLEDRITVVAAAVGAAAGRSAFRVHPSGAMGRLDAGAGREGGFVDEIVVDVVALDDFIYRQGHRPPQVVKLDLEGGEGQALAGMRRLLREQPPCLLIEIHGPQAAEEVVQELAAACYRLHRMESGYAEIDAIQASLPRHIVARAVEVTP
jgi:FkbM family methyltransferase